MYIMHYALCLVLRDGETDDEFLLGSRGRYRVQQSLPAWSDLCYIIKVWRRAPGKEKGANELLCLGKVIWNLRIKGDKENSRHEK